MQPTNPRTHPPTLSPFRVNSVSHVFGSMCPCGACPVCVLHGGRYVGVLKKFSSVVEGSVIEGQMDPAVVGKFKMTPLESSMASDLKKAAEANDSVSRLDPSAVSIDRGVYLTHMVWSYIDRRYCRMVAKWLGPGWLVG